MVSSLNFFPGWLLNNYGAFVVAFSYDELQSRFFISFKAPVDRQRWKIHATTRTTETNNVRGSDDDAIVTSHRTIPIAECG